MNNEDKYLICEKLDEPKRYVGLTLDEFIPVVGIVGICFCMGSLLTGLALAMLVWVLIRYFKKGQGTGWLLNLIYWHLPSFIVKGLLLPHLPDSSQRHWLR